MSWPTKDVLDPKYPFREFRQRVIESCASMIGYLKGRSAEDLCNVVDEQIYIVFDLIHGETDTYDDLENVVTSKNLIPLIQNVYDTNMHYMGRLYDNDEPFVVDMPTAVVFCHELLIRDYPDLTLRNYTEEEARGIVDEASNADLTIEQIQENERQVPKGGKKRTRRARRTRRTRRTRRARKTRRYRK